MGSANNPASNMFPLSNDEYGMRQFLYPSLTAVPEPSSLAMLLIVGTSGILIRLRRQKIDRNSFRDPVSHLHCL